MESSSPSAWRRRLSALLGDACGVRRYQANSSFSSIENNAYFNKLLFSYSYFALVDWTGISNWNSL